MPSSRQPVGSPAYPVGLRESVSFALIRHGDQITTRCWPGGIGRCDPAAAIFRQAEPSGGVTIGDTASSGVSLGRLSIWALRPLDRNRSWLQMALVRFARRLGGDAALLLQVPRSAFGDLTRRISRSISLARDWFQYAGGR